MTEESTTNIRLNRIEADIKDLKICDKEHYNSLISVEKSNIKTESNIEKILETLTELKMTTAENKISLDENLKKATITENLALNLKKSTDSLTIDVTTIKEKPMRSYETIKLIIIGILATNIVGIVWSMWIKH